MPCDWTNNSKWSFGEAGDLIGPYWEIPEHNYFVVSNDDACDCDMMEDRLITPPLIIDNTEDNVILSFSSYFTGDYGSTANLEISNDLGYSWQNLVLVPNSNQWQELTYVLNDFISSDTIMIAFRHSDGHSWGSGFAIDDVVIEFQCIDDDGDGVCNSDEIYGCTSEIANNFNELATEDDGSCQIDVYGCTYNVAINYNPEANIDDGSCDFGVSGCTDASAENYNPDANIDDGSCVFCNDFSVLLLGISDVSSVGASDGSVQATGTGGSNNYSISVQDANGIEQNPFALAAGDYTVTVTDLVTTCVGSESFTIAEPVVAEEPCDIVPSGLFVNNIIHNRITFNWSAPSAAPSHYMIRYRVVGTSSWTVMTAGPVNSNEFNGTSRTRYFMEPGTTYEWSMRARVLNEDGSTNCQSSWSANSEYTNFTSMC